MTTTLPLILSVMRCSSAIDHGLGGGGIARAFDLDTVGRARDFREIFGAELDRGGVDILLQPVELGRARDRHDPGLLREQPGERDLRRRRALALRDRADQIDQRLVGGARLLR